MAACGEAALAGGALHLAIVEALRLAATPADMPGKHATAVAALRGVIAGLGDPLRRAHVAALVEAALATAVLRRLGADLPPHDGRLGGWMDDLGGSGPGGAAAPPGVGPLAPGDLDRYGAAASAADVDVVLFLCREALRDVIALRKAGRDASDA